VVLFVEAMNKAAEISMAIKVSLFGFQNTLIPFKDADRALDDRLRKDMASMPELVKARNSNYNNDGFCLDNAAMILRASPIKDKILIVLSDGEPCGDKVHRVPKFKRLNQNEELRQVIKQISAAGDLRLLALGLGTGTDHVKNFYDDSLPNVENIPSVDLGDLVEILSEKIVKLIS
jgi:cobalamin biosynthesis protein CobT